MRNSSWSCSWALALPFRGILAEVTLLSVLTLISLQLATQFYSGLFGNRHGRSHKCRLWPPPGIKGCRQHKVAQRLHCSSQAWDTDYLNYNLPDKGPLSGWFWVTVVRNLLCFHWSCKERSTAAPFWMLMKESTACKHLPLVLTCILQRCMNPAWHFGKLAFSSESSRTLYLHLWSWNNRFDWWWCNWQKPDVSVWRACITGHYFCIHDVVKNVIK